MEPSPESCSVRIPIGQVFEEYHWISANGPIRLEYDTDIVGLRSCLTPNYHLSNRLMAGLSSFKHSGLTGFLRLLKETEHFCHWLQQEVAKIVHCGEKIAEEAIRKGGLKIFPASI